MNCKIRITYSFRNIFIEVEREFEAEVELKELVVDMLKQISEVTERLAYWPIPKGRPKR